MSAPIVVHLVRHGRVASHKGDMPITPEGQAEVDAAAARLVGEIGEGERIEFLCTATQRSRQTAEMIREHLAAALRNFATVGEIRQERAIRNPDLYLAGRRVQMMANAEAVSHQIPDSGLTAEDVERVDFFHKFFRSHDRIQYWVEHAGPPGEDLVAVARRILTFCQSLADDPTEQPRRFVCVTHSPVMRAVLVHYLGFDPGEPDWVERIDLAVDPAGTTITFRDRSKVARV